LVWQDYFVEADFVWIDFTVFFGGGARGLGFCCGCVFLDFYGFFCGVYHDQFDLYCGDFE
jgi:hypothetical protein